MLQPQSFRRTGWVSVAGLFVLLGAPIAAQQATAPGRLGVQFGAARTQTQTAPTQNGHVLELSMDQAVQMGIEANLGLKAAKLNVDMAIENIIGAQAAFLPAVQSSVADSSVQEPAQTLANGTISVASQSSLSFSSQVAQVLPWAGFNYEVQWSGNRQDSAGSFATFNPATASTFLLAFSQPLLRGLMIDSNRYGVESNKEQKDITDLNLEQQVLTLKNAIELGYLGIIANQAGVDVATQNLDLANKEVTQLQARLAVGQAAQMDVVSASASVATDEVQLSLAQQQLANAQDNLRQLILDPTRQDFWTVEFKPTDQLKTAKFEPDIPAATKTALASRLDLLQARQNVKLDDLTDRLDKDQTRASVNLNVQYAASGSGGTESLNGVTTTKAYTSVLGEAFGFTYPQWTAQVQVGYPIGQTAALASLAHAQLNKRQQDLTVQQLEIAVVGAIVQASRDVALAYQQYQQAQAAVDLSQRQVDGANQQFQVGQTDSFTVLQKEQLLAVAKVTLVNALVSYNQALLEYQRVQKIP